MIPEPVAKARLKETENITRFQTYCVLMDRTVNEELILGVKKVCLDYYTKNPKAGIVPKDVILSVFDAPGTVELPLKDASTPEEVTPPQPEGGEERILPPGTPLETGKNPGSSNEEEPENRLPS